MVVVDPIADMLTRIRNANQMKYNEVSMPVSRVKTEIAKILKDEGFIADYKISDEKPQGTLTLTLKYSNNKKESRELFLFLAFSIDYYKYLQKGC